MMALSMCIPYPLPGKYRQVASKKPPGGWNVATERQVGIRIHEQNMVSFFSVDFFLMMIDIIYVALTPVLDLKIKMRTSLLDTRYHQLVTDSGAGGQHAFY